MNTNLLLCLLIINGDCKLGSNSTGMLRFKKALDNMTVWDDRISLSFKGFCGDNVYLECDDVSMTESNKMVT